jgi:drug/metabolite transporter (DMT)-like permease
MRRGLDDNTDMQISINQYFRLFAAITIFSFVPIVVKLTSANPFTIGFFRLILASSLLSLVWKKKIDFLAFKKRSFWKLLLIGLCFFAHWLTYTFSVKVSGPSFTVMGMATYGVQLIFYGSLFLNYNVNKKNIFCLIFILIGVALVIPNWSMGNNTTLGLVLALVSASFYAAIPILLQKSHEFNQETRVFYQFSIALIGYTFLLPFSDYQSLALNDWLALIFLGVFGTFIAHTLWSGLVSSLPTTTTGISYYLITPSAMFISFIVFEEVLSFWQILGACIILSSALTNHLINHHLNKKGSLK